MLLTADLLIKIAGPVKASKKKKQREICTHLASALNIFAPHYGLDYIVNLSRFLGQCSIESDRFSTTREYASGAAYEGRRDLGNIHPGDGKRYRGRGIIQTTGRANHVDFNNWAKKALPGILKADVPDFVKHPEALEAFPFAFFSAAYYWDKRDLNRYCQQNNDRMLTKRINGGYNHLNERIEATERAALILLGYEPTTVGIRKFQAEHNLLADGIVGQMTFNALHKAMLEVRITAKSPTKQEAPATKLPERAPPPPAPAPVPTAPMKPVKRPGFWSSLIIALFSNWRKPR